MAKTFSGTFKLAPGTIFSGYTSGTVEDRDGTVVIASEPGGRNSLEGNKASMLSLANAIADACGQSFAKSAPVVTPAPHITGLDSNDDDTVTVSFDDGSQVVLREAPHQFIPVAL